MLIKITKQKIISKNFSKIILIANTRRKVKNKKKNMNKNIIGWKNQKILLKLQKIKKKNKILMKINK